MIRKNIIFAIFCFGFLFLSACKDNIVGISSDGNYKITEDLSGDIVEGDYNYIAYDSLGTVVAKGTLSFKFRDSIITGKWGIKKVGDPQNIGPQVGKGELEGSLTDGKLSVGLNPNFADNNVFLQGEPERKKYTGKWFYSSFIGLTNWGWFEITIR